MQKSIQEITTEIVDTTDYGEDQVQESVQEVYTTIIKTSKDVKEEVE